MKSKPLTTSNANEEVVKTKTLILLWKSLVVPYKTEHTFNIQCSNHAP